jgi:hypothetical protein
MAGKKQPVKAGAKYKGNRRHARRFVKNMTKKDYVHAASSIAKLPKARRKAMAEDLAKMFQSDNPRFDRSRFLAACGV